MGDMGALGNIKPVAPVTTLSGRKSEIPERFRDHIYSEVRINLTQKLDESSGAQRTPEPDIADYIQCLPMLQQ